MATAGKKRKKRTGIKRTDKEQSARFIASAKELGLESSEAFERAIAALTTPKKPKPKD